MTEYVRICPRCAEFEPEYEATCSHCGHFLGAEAVVPKPDMHVDESTHEIQPEANVQSGTATAPDQTPTQDSKLYLELPGNGEVLTAKSGDIIGQSHDSSTAQLQISTNIPGCQFVHRHHCRIERSHSLDEQGNTTVNWWITPLSQLDHGSEFTNPTSINQQKINPDKKAMIKDGDIVSLSGLQLKVCIIE